MLLMLFQNYSGWHKPGTCLVPHFSQGKRLSNGSTGYSIAVSPEKKKNRVERRQIMSNEQYDPALLVPKVTASCHSDDYAVVVESFDATPWFADPDTTDEDITSLKEEGYGGDYTADEVAREAAAYDERVAELFTYLDIVNGHRRGGDPCGFGCYVNEDEAETWVAAHRPRLIEQWEKDE
jgi:hypothetical protein